MATARPRRVEHTESTRQALVDSAVVLFTKKGYAGTSLDEIAKRARVTKGALYHHFNGKQALFEAAFEEVETQVVRRLSAELFGSGNIWETVRAGLREFLKVCLEPSYQRIVVHEAPAVMGWERWREAEERFTFGVIREALRALVDAGEFTPLPVEALAHVVFGALSAGATTIAGSAQQKKTSAEVGEVVDAVMQGLRAV
ncbi:TetR/AcrR family transcriptional regulator [Saccharopolyspora sp. NFXS83]|uniref:TetR/AcrR family transcriptional regulator n=1 Tax=Saccharopolyspora sp. NFXS83 TaxID=2993560 RepID=UPI00224B2662|nr:TetR/AcrR family transcriptional regulator [Saccharopolyspora sp. NFXS83]MCX2734363.1 TetR/AcrR family transcriptional regulator [Saccharopolyspora sp. NFXS83]